MVVKNICRNKWITTYKLHFKVGFFTFTTTIAIK